MISFMGCAAFDTVLIAKLSLLPSSISLGEDSLDVLILRFLRPRLVTFGSPLLSIFGARRRFFDGFLVSGGGVPAPSMAKFLGFPLDTTIGGLRLYVRVVVVVPVPGEHDVCCWLGL